MLFYIIYLSKSIITVYTENDRKIAEQNALNHFSKYIV
jgi:hypothetical protein